jgi:hypothetical protein
MFGHRTHGADGLTYDSESEERVARALFDLARERVVVGYFAHPRIAGLVFDFLVHMGPGAGEQNGRVVLVEYDGLGEARPDDLGAKLERHGRLQEVGLSVRWLLSPDESAVREMLLDYHPPHFVTKKMICTCGEVRSIVVIAHKAKNKGELEIEGSFQCSSCRAGTK